MPNSHAHLEAVRVLHDLVGTRESRHVIIPAILGNGSGVVDVPGRTNYDYVRLYGDESRVKPAFNLAVASVDDVAVNVEEVRGAHGAIGYIVVGLVQAIAAAGGPGTTASVTSLAKSGDAALQGAVTLTGTAPIVLTEAAQDIAVSLASTAVTPGTYGDASNIPQVTIDAQGRITAAANVAITASGAADVGHEHGLDRYAASSGQTVFDLTSYASQIELCSDNGSIIDPQTYTLSADGSQVTMDSGITAAHVVTINYILVAI